MKLAIFSDTHDNIWKLDSALGEIAEVDVLVHCGDLCSPFMIKRLGEAAAGRPIHIVWGNNDGDTHLMCQVASQYPEIHLHGPMAQLTIDGVRIAVNHYPEIARPLAASGSYDLVCYGHDHTAYQGRSGECVLLNPGELMGLYGKTTFAVFDTGSRSVDFVEVT